MSFAQYIVVELAKFRSRETGSRSAFLTTAAADETEGPMAIARGSSLYISSSVGHAGKRVRYVRW